MGNLFENEKFRLEYFPLEGIIDFFIKNKEIDRADVIKMHQEVMLLTGKKKHCNLFRATDFLNVSSEARKEGEKEEYTEGLVAQAFVATNLAQKLIGNFIMRFNKPKVNTRMFSTDVEAKEWLANKMKAFENKRTSTKDLMVI